MYYSYVQYIAHVGTVAGGPGGRRAPRPSQVHMSLLSIGLSAARCLQLTRHHTDCCLCFSDMSNLITTTKNVRLVNSEQ